jgi:hypothetical protein
MNNMHFPWVYIIDDCVLKRVDNISQYIQDEIVFLYYPEGLYCIGHIESDIIRKYMLMNPSSHCCGYYISS